MAALVEVPVALLKFSTICCDSGESVIVVLREPLFWSSGLATDSRREGRLATAEDEVLALIALQ
jgi:hypothetical protein